MIAILRGKMITDWADFSDRITLHHADVLKFSPNFEKYQLIANIPYYITSQIFFHFLYPQNFAVPEEMVILMQKEVGEKILATKGKKTQHSYFSLAMWLACENIEKICLVPSESFDPAPKVDSIVLKFFPKKNRDIDTDLQKI